VIGTIWACVVLAAVLVVGDQGADRDAAGRRHRARRTVDGQHRRSGMFWMVDSLPSGNVMIWHNGATGGYSAFLAVFPEARRAVAILASVSRPADQQRIALGLARSHS
jgi:CubicO group peptidase (beta-lactamase class C family)